MTNKREHLKHEIIYSSIEDKNIEKDINNSPIWQQCYHLDDLPEDFKGFEYKIAFDGLKPVQVLSAKKY